MNYLYACLLILGGHCFYIVGQERLRPEQQIMIANAKKIRAERSYADMSSIQKISYVQTWLFNDFYEDLEALEHSKTQILYEEPEVTFEEVQEELGNIYKALEDLCIKGNLNDCDRCWLIELMNDVQFLLLPINNSQEMLNMLLLQIKHYNKAQMKKSS